MKHPYKVITLCLLAITTYLQASAQKPVVSKTEAPSAIDTLIVRLNNQLYYTLTENKHWVASDGKVNFRPLNPNDTFPNISLDYINSKPLLIARLRKGDTIKNCLIGEMKLSFSDFMDETQKKNAVHNICSRRMLFVNCVFNRILADTTVELFEDESKDKKKLSFKEDVMFLNCNFSKGLELSNCNFEKKFILTGQVSCSSPSSIDNCEFYGICYLSSSPDYNKGSSYLKISSCIFDNPFIFSVSDNDRAHITLERCKFNNVFSLAKSIPRNIYKRFHATINPNYVDRVNSYVTTYAGFLKNKYKKEYTLTDDSIQAFIPNTHIAYNIAIVHCKAKVMDIANTSLMDCSLEDVAISQCLDVTGATFNYSATYTGKEALEDIDFPGNNCIIYASYKTFSPDAFKLNIYMEKVAIHPLVHNYFDTASDFIQDNSNFFNMIKDYAAKRFPNQDMVTVLKARFEHERAEWERKYHGAHIVHSDGVGDFFGSIFQWTLAAFLEMTVATGYKGEMRFALWVVLLLLLFSTIYYFKHKEAVIDYLNSNFNKDAAHIEGYETLKVHRSFNWFRDFMRCLWFSCLVFVDPRLPISFFNLRVGLFGLVLTEWLCGLTAILLFLVFLASNYPFIHSIIGI